MSKKNEIVTDKKLFFSYTTVSPLCDESYRAVKKFLDEFYTLGPPEVLYKYDFIYKELADEAAKLLNCEPEEITYVKNTTEGIIIASETLPLSPGDEVLVLSNEYPANLLPWLKKRKEGIKVKLVGGRDNPKAFDELISSISARTKAISISTSQSYDGYMFDLPLLSKICRQKKIYLILDAVQTVGTRKIDLKKTPADFLICGSQKYLRAGTGSGFMYVNKRIVPRLRDYKVGIRSMSRFDESSYTLKPTAERFQDGTQNLAGLVSLTAALRLVNRTGIEVIEGRNLELLDEIKACLRDHGIPFIDHGGQQGNIIALTVENPYDLFEFLKARNVYIKPIKDVARLSFIHETRLEDIEKAAALIGGWLRADSAAKTEFTSVAVQTV